MSRKKLFLARFSLVFFCFFWSSCRKQAPDTLTPASYAGSVHCKNAVGASNIAICHALLASIVPAPPWSDEAKPNVIAQVIKVNSHFPESDKNRPKDCKGDCTYSGTGVVIAPGYILTAYHVVEKCEHISVSAPIINEKGEVTDWKTGAPAELVKRGNETVDYAILRITNPKDIESLPKPVMVAAGWDAQQNMVVWHFGKTSGPQNGVVLNPALKCVAARGLVPLNISIKAGDSGGPIFYGDTLVAYVIHFNDKVCQARIQVVLDEIGYDP